MKVQFACLSFELHHFTRKRQTLFLLEFVFQKNLLKENFSRNILFKIKVAENDHCLTFSEFA